MHRRQFLRCSLASLPLVAQAGASAPPALQWASRTLLGFGTTLSVQAAHEDADPLQRALDAAVALLQHLHGQMNLFDPASALSRLNRDGVLHQPPPELLAVLQRAQAISARSGGAFDVTVQPLWLLHARCAAEGRQPTRVELAAARALVGWRGLQVAPHAVRLARPGMAVTLNGIAQGHAADAVAALLRRHGIAHALVDGGEWAALGQSPRAQPWTLAVADPRDPQAWLARLALQGGCLATSADNPSCFTPDFRHHHILDPRTGDSPPDVAEVAVWAPEGALADALTKVMFMAGPQRALALAAQWQVELLVVDKTGHTWATPGLPQINA
jgi:thiamine biosynthesis lipoprotein